MHAAHREKKNWDALNKVLAPGSTVGKLSSSTTVIKESKQPEMRVRNSDVAKIGTKHERDTDLDKYADRIPPKINEKTIEQKIENHKKDHLRNDLGSQKKALKETIG